MLHPWGPLRGSQGWVSWPAMALFGVGFGVAMCAPGERGLCADVFRNVGVMWVALELSGTFAVNSDFLLPLSYHIMRTYDEIPRMLKL